MSELHRDGKCTQYFHDLLYLIEEDMMVLRAQDRVTSRGLSQKLREMDWKVQQDESYSRTPCESSRLPNTQQPLDVVYRQPPPKPRQAR